ncbi:hypothetical protein ACH5RR_008753 [Cinchona calisaya]|uniref:Tf2-1-like SH3-like domain-containing protein n=1 Tax=Cinchona calisaya TaxID=153742 RepID=A0ABD3ACD5_9GENT
MGINHSNLDDAIQMTSLAKKHVTRYGSNQPIISRANSVTTQRSAASVQHSSTVVRVQNSLISAPKVTEGEFLQLVLLVSLLELRGERKCIVLKLLSLYVTVLTDLVHLILVVALVGNQDMANRLVHKDKGSIDRLPVEGETLVVHRVSEDAEAFAEHVKKIHNEVRLATETSNERFKEAANEHQCFKEFTEGQVMVYLRTERFPKRAFHKLKSRKIGPYIILKKISSNAYMVEFSDDLQTSPKFNVSDLYDFHEFDAKRGQLW